MELFTRKEGHKITKNSDQKEMDQWEFIYNYRPTSDILTLRVGWLALGGIAGLTGGYINMYYRKKLNMYNYGNFSTYLPLTIVPAVTSAVYHHMFVTSDIVFEKRVCSVCSELKGQALQISLGVLYPLVMGPLCCYMVSSRYYTARIPSIASQRWELWEYHKKISKRLYRSIWYFTAFQMITTAVITHFERTDYLRLKTKLEKIERIMSRKEAEQASLKNI